MRKIACSATLCFILIGVAVLGRALPEGSEIDQKWTRADGIPSAMIYGIARTPDGWLWIGTSNGLVRFDGVRFDPFPALASTSISYMISGPDSCLYVATLNAGLAIICGDQVRRVTQTGNSRISSISVILPVGYDEAWVGTHGGQLYHYKANMLNEVSVGTLPDIFGLTKTQDGVLWIGTDNGLFTLRHHQLASYHPQKPLPTVHFSDLAVSENGSLFAATTGGLLRIDGDQWRFWTVKDGLPTDFIMTLASAGKDLWIGTSKGVARLKGNVIERFSDATCPIFSLLPERDGGVWLGCEGREGLHRLRYPLLRDLPLPKAIVGARIYSVLQDRSGAIWIASSWGVAKWRNNKVTLYTTKDGLASSMILAISLAPDNSIWVGTQSGFAHLNQAHIETFHTMLKGSSDRIFSILQDKSGTLWIGTGHGLLQRRSNEKEPRLMPQIKSGVTSLREDAQGNVWVTTTNSGLFRFSAQATAQYGLKSGLRTNGATDTLPMSNGDTWVTTQQGLVRIRNGQCSALDSTNGLPPGPALTVVDDGQDHLWVRYSTGLFVLKIADLNKALDRTSKTVSGSFIGRGDGLGDDLNENAGQNSLMRCSSGDLWFASFVGMVTINPLLPSHQTQLLRPKILHVMTDVGERDQTQRILLNPDDRNLHFSFSAPTLDGGKSLQYRHRLVGFDEQWRESSAMYPVAYTSLPPGKYRFEVSARRPYGSWASASASIDLRVLPHFYQTWWWYSLMAMIALFTPFALYKRRLATMRKQFAALMQERLDERSRLARELHDTVSQSLTVIQIQLDTAQVLLNRDLPALSSHLEKVCALAHETTKDVRMSISALRSREISHLSLQQMLQLGADTFASTNSMQVILNAGDTVPAWSEEIRHEILRILQEALSNVSLHSGAESVILSAQAKKDYVLFVVQDDGVGFEPPSRNNWPQGHFGLAGMKERAQRISGKISVNSSLGSGTRVSLLVPLQSDYNWKTSFWTRVASTLRAYIGVKAEGAKGTGMSD